MDHKIGYVDLEHWSGPGHRTCETARHSGRGWPAAVVIALAPLDGRGNMDSEAGQVWGACIECFGLMDQDMRGPWQLPGSYSGR